MTLAKAVGACLLSALAATRADEAPKALSVKAGLWQLTIQHPPAVATAVRPELLARMTPQQRSRVAAKMRARAEATPQLETKQYCVSLDRPIEAAFREEHIKGCRRQVKTANARLFEYRDECNDNGLRFTVEVHIEAPDSATAKGSVETKSEGQFAPASSLGISGKWLTVDCGEKPKAIPNDN